MISGSSLCISTSYSAAWPCVILSGRLSAIQVSQHIECSAAAIRVVSAWMATRRSWASASSRARGHRPRSRRSWSHALMTPPATAAIAPTEAPMMVATAGLSPAAPPTSAISGPPARSATRIRASRASRSSALMSSRRAQLGRRCPHRRARARSIHRGARAFENVMASSRYPCSASPCSSPEASSESRGPSAGSRPMRAAGLGACRRKADGPGERKRDDYGVPHRHGLDAPGILDVRVRLRAQGVDDKAHRVAHSSGPSHLASSNRSCADPAMR